MADKKRADKKRKAPINVWLDNNPLRLWRLRHKGITQARLAQELGCTRQAVYLWESGSSLPSTQKMMMLQELTGLTPNDLLQWRKSKPLEELLIEDEERESEEDE